MEKNTSMPKIGYVVKMFPRLSETFILNEILELERRGVEIVIFSLKKPNEGQFHPQLSDLKARALYLESLDPKKWVSWLGEVWASLLPHREQFWPLLEQAITRGDSSGAELLLRAAWLGAKAKDLGLSRLHAHFASLPSTAAYFSHLITGIPFSFTAHAKDIFVYGQNEHLLAEKLAAAEFVVTVTNYNYRYLMKVAPETDAEAIKVIHNGVDLDRLKPDTAQHRQADLILGVGRLVPKKGFNILLDACRLLKERGVPFRCVIAGDGTETASLMEKRQELGLSNAVIFLGSKRQDEIIDLMHKATLLCLPCTIASDGNKDALPTVILEAMACGLPVVSTTISGIPEIIDSEINGLLVEPENPVMLSEQLVRLLSSKNLQAKLARSGLRKVAEKFDLKKNVDSLLKLYLKKNDQKKISKSAQVPSTRKTL